MAKKPQYILGIDPGSEASGWVVLDNHENIVLASAQEKEGRTPNDILLRHLQVHQGSPFWLSKVQQAGIEKITLYQRADNNVHDTILWYGRFMQVLAGRGIPVLLHPRQKVFSFLCPGVQKTSDAAINAAIKDRLGPPGTKKNPGPTYGVKGHSWQALSVAMHNAAVGGVAMVGRDS